MSNDRQYKATYFSSLSASVLEEEVNEYYAKQRIQGGYAFAWRFGMKCPTPLGRRHWTNGILLIASR